MQLKLYGIQGTVLEWITSYLTGRSQVVKIDGEISESLSCDIGVPQGSVLGPLLFITYINDIQYIVKHSKVILFADDTLIYIEGDNLQDMCTKLNEDINLLLQYFDANKLKVHPEKFQCMLVTTSEQKRQTLLHDYPEAKIKIKEEKLQFQESMKYLGVKIDSTLTFDNHVQYMTSKLSKKVGYLKRIGTHLSQWARLVIYNTIIEPHFNYCATVLFDLKQQDLSTLQKLQNKAMRAILQCHYRTHRIDMLQKLGWLSIYQKNIVKVLIFIRDSIIDENSEFQHYLKKNCEVHKHNTRGSQKFHLPIQNNNSAQKSIFIKGLKIFNDLPTELRDATHVSRNVFKDRVSQFITESIPILPHYTNY